MRIVRLQFVTAVLLSILLALPLIAQTNRGAIRGSALDPSGAGIPGVDVQAENVGTGIKTTTRSNETGGFIFLSLQPGSYRLTAELAGFKRAVAENVAVHIGETTRADIQLQLGDISQSVEVSSTAALVTPDTATAGTVITSEEYEKLPLAGSSRSRIATDFALLTPGVVGGQQRPGTDHTATTALSVDGGANQTTDVLVEGMSGSQVWSFGSFTEMGVPVDAVQEFNLIKGIMPAEYGYVRTSLLSFSLKSGTNNLRGSVFENFRNTVLNSRSFFDSSKRPFNQNNFGGTVSGPVYIPYLYDGRDRTFFMFSGDGSIFRGTSNVRVYTSPTKEFLKGDFSQLKTATGQLRPIYDPATTKPDGKGGVTREVFPGNIIPDSRISPISRQVAALIPAPNRPGTDANFVGREGAASLNNTFLSTKVDHRFNAKHSISSSFNYTQLPRITIANPYEGTPLLTGLNQNIGSRNFRLSYDFVITPNTLNHWSFGYNRFNNRSASFSAGEGWPEKLGLKGVGGDGSMPVFQFSSDGYPKMALERWDADVEENVMMRNTTAFIRGKHSWKVGFEMRSQRWKPRRWRNQAGTFNYSYKETGLNASTATGNAFASFLLGYVDAANISTPQHVRSDRPYYAWFVQDDIKVTTKLTVNAGLRYDLDLSPFEQYDRASTFDLTTPNPGAGNLPGALIFAGNGPGLSGLRSFEDIYYRAFGPRLGMAYQVNKKSVVRLGYGISHSANNLQNTFLGFSTTANFVSPDNGNSPAFLIDNGMPTNWPKPPFIDPSFGNNNNVNATIRNDSARMPMTQIWRLDVQHELPGGHVVEAAYSGTRGTHLGTGLRTLNQVDAQYLSLGSVLTANITSPAAVQAGIKPPYPGFKGTVAQALRPYPQVLSISTMDDKLGSSTYHSMQLKVQKRFSTGLQYLVSYTYSKLMTNVTSGMQGVSDSAVQDTGNRRAEWSVAAYDTPQNFWVSTIYALPFGQGRKYVNRGGFMNALIGGWNLSLVLNYQSGLPLVITQTNRVPLFNASQRPDRVSGAAVRNDVSYGDFDPAVNRLFNPASFTQAGTYAFGNASPRLNDARGFGIRKEDLALRKFFTISGERRLEMNLQSFNLLNRPYWGSANSNVSSSDFGKVTSAGPGRFVQIGLKLYF